MVIAFQIVRSVFGKTRLFLMLALLLTVFLTPLSAQTALRMELILQEKALSWSNAAAFTLEAADLKVFSNTEEAFRYAQGQKWLPKKALPDDPARFDGIALLMMRAFGLKGGLFYSIARNPHYAYRELVYNEVIQGRTDPGMIVSGPDFLFMIGRVLSLTEEAEAAKRQAAQIALAKSINSQLAGLADATVTNEGVIISISNIQFLANSAVLADSEKAKLREIAEILKTIPDKRIIVTGHTAEAGTRADQRKTSSERAQAAADYLVSCGARPAGAIEVFGYGAERPIADNSTEQGMAANRRVEIIILD
jgi:outer membrane protein OmpA-like peptidoglycan-associated protein